MLKILIITEPTKYTYHTAISDMLQTTLQEQGYSVTIIDINAYKYDHECLNDVISLQPDVLITLDLAGFRFRTQAGEIAFNMLPSKNLNLLWGNKAEYAPFLQKKLSLSMLFYDVSGINNKVEQMYPNLLYYKVAGAINCSAASESNVLMNQQIIQEIWKDFLNETLLQTEDLLSET